MATAKTKTSNALKPLNFELLPQMPEQLLFFLPNRTSLIYRPDEK